MTRSARAWEDALRAHREALDALLRTAEAVPEAAWHRPRPGDAWSPAQIAEHLALSFEVVERELTEGAAMAPRLSPGWQRLLRWTLLPLALLRHRFPGGARSPRELRPSERGVARAEAAARLRGAAERVEAALRGAASGGRSMTHPYFGRLRPIAALRFSVLHLDHHRRQMLEAVPRQDSPAPEGARPSAGG